MSVSEVKGQAEGPDPSYAKLCGDTTRQLTAEEIADRIKRFNASRPYDWSIFDDVPPSQHVAIMYPFTFKQS